MSVLYQVHVPVRLEMDLTSGVSQAFKRAKLFIHLTSVATIIATTTPATQLLLQLLLALRQLAADIELKWLRLLECPGS